jgi:1,2-diacylglycerol 3-alpha-glucosyltransferase
MHIAHFTNAYHPVINGVVRSISTFRTALTEQGHNVFIFAQNAPNYLDLDPFIFRYPTLPIRLPSDFPATIPISPFIDRVLPHLHLDVIHTHHPVLLGETAVIKARDLDLPLVFTFHTQYREYSHYFPIHQARAQEIVKETIEYWTGEYLLNCNFVVAPSVSMFQKIMETFDVEEGFLSVIPTGIDLRQYRQVNRNAMRTKLGWTKEIVLISVGRLAVEKNCSTLLKAAALAMQRCPQLRMVYIGDGPQAKSLQKLAKTLRISDRVEFMGKVPFKEIPAYLKAADLFVFASVTETQGLVTLEAIAAGLPIAAVDGTGTCDIVENGKEGILTSDSPEALSNAIMEIIDNPILRKEFHGNALEKAQNFDILRLAKQLQEVYQQAIENKKQNRFVQIRKQEALVDRLGLREFIPFLQN